ncbi:MAG: DUF1513 domain-containing protein [Deltaproteobacteria bacterium]|nr:DUF1513 domain-containing protein [Deltaproteobacteria bacterium]
MKKDFSNHLSRRKVLFTAKKKISLALMFSISKPLFAFEKLSKIVLKKNTKDNKNSSFNAVGFGRKPSYNYNRPQPELIFHTSEIVLITNQQKYYSIKVSFLPHSIIQNLKKPNIVTIVPKWGHKAVEYNLFTKKITSTCELEKYSLFFGHGFYNPDGNSIYLSEHSESTSESYISQWKLDTSTAKRIKNIRTGGLRVHDCQLSLDGKYIIAANSSFSQDSKIKPSLAWIDIKTNKIETQLYFETFGPTHFYQTTDGYFIYGGGASLPGSEKLEAILGVVTPEKKIVPLKVPQEMKAFFYGEALSLIANEPNNIAYASLPSSDSVFAFNYLTGKFIKRLNIKAAQGLSLSDDRSILMVSSVENYSELYKFNSVSFEQLPMTITPKKLNEYEYNWGSHIFKLKYLEI